jgi:glycosyltransferase involved in cell wall biosynthesis
MKFEREPGRPAPRRIAAHFNAGGYDAVFSPGTGVPVYAHLPASIPVFSYLDATKRSWIRTYFGMETLCARSRAHVDAVDRVSLGNNSLTFFSSEWARDEAERDYGIATDRMAVVPFGANLVDPPTKAEVKTWIDARPRDRLKLFFLGKEWERKGGPEALALVRELHRRGIPVLLHIVGCTPAIADADRALVELHGFIDHSQLAGQKKIRELLAGSHVLLFLSRAEAYGIAVCEAAAFGVPTYGSNTGGIPTIIRPGVNGWLARLPFDATAAATELQTVLADSSAYQRLALGARDDFDARLNWPAVATNLVRQISAVLEKRRAKTAA